LDDIEKALREIFTTEWEEDEAFDNATRSLDLLRPFVVAQIDVVAAARHLHAGLTCQNDPMDVDERIALLGAALIAGGVAAVVSGTPPPTPFTAEDAQRLANHVDSLGGTQPPEEQS